MDTAPISDSLDSEFFGFNELEGGVKTKFAEMFRLLPDKPIRVAQQFRPMRNAVELIIFGKSAVWRSRDGLVVDESEHKFEGTAPGDNARADIDGTVESVIDFYEQDHERWFREWA